MTPALISKAQRMYDSRQFTMADIAASCSVRSMTIYRNIRTDSASARTHLRRRPPRRLRGDDYRQCYVPVLLTGHPRAVWPRRRAP